MNKINYKKPIRKQVESTIMFLTQLDHISASLNNSALSDDYWSICLLNGRIQSLAEQSQTIKNLAEKRISLGRKDIIYG